MRQSEESEKDLTAPVRDRICPTSRRTERKRGYLRAVQNVSGVEGSSVSVVQLSLCS